MDMIKIHYIHAITIHKANLPNKRVSKANLPNKRVPKINHSTLKLLPLSTVSAMRREDA